MWLLDAGHYDEAATQFKEALRRAPVSWILYNNLAFANAERGKDLPEAISLINEALKHWPKDPNYLDTKGWILFKQGKNTEATSVLEQASRLAPNDKEIAKHLDEVKLSASQSKR
jgi:tetratricopeptide (TPR) repeat protein